MGNSTPNCSECGKFCKIIDSGIHYDYSYSCIGGAPFEPYFFCKKCLIKKLKIAKNTPEKLILEEWCKNPGYIAIAKAILRHRRNL